MSADAELMSADTFAKLKVPEMKAYLKTLHDSKKYGKVKRSGTKPELIAEFKKIRGNATTDEVLEEGDEEGVEEGDEETTNEELAKAQAMIDAVIIPIDRKISKGTKRVMKALGYPRRNYDMRKHEDNITDKLEQVYAFYYALHYLLSSLEVTHNHSANHDALREQLHDAYQGVRLEDTRFSNFFSAQGLDLKAPDLNIQIGMQAATSENVDTAIHEEVAILRLVVQHQMYS
jgi:hypothetical protein